MKILKTMAAISTVLSLVATGIAQDSEAQGGDGAGTSPEAAARSSLDTALAELLAVITDAALTDEQRVASIESIVRDRFDLEVVARLALGKRKDLLSGSAAARYVCEFEAYLPNYIGSRLDRYQQLKIEIVGAERHGSYVVVRTRILGGPFDRAVIDFVMRESGGRWRAVDVQFAGISVVKLLRADFKDQLSAGGLERLVQSLGEKNGSRSDC